MAKKATTTKKTTTPTKAADSTTAVRHSAIPKVAKSATPVTKVIGHAEIARRAFEISLSSNADETANWLAAERELLGK